MDFPELFEREIIPSRQFPDAVKYHGKNVVIVGAQLV